MSDWVPVSPYDEVARLMHVLRERNAELEKLRTESAERARVDMATIEDLETQLHARKFDVFNLENRSEDLERQLSEARATVELLHEANTALQARLAHTQRLLLEATQAVGR
jgi:chromosome segregation ATPase